MSSFTRLKIWNFCWIIVKNLSGFLFITNAYLHSINQKWITFLLYKNRKHIPQRITGMCFLHRCVHIRLLSIKFNTPNKIQPNHHNALTGIFSSDKWLTPWYLWGYAHQYQLHHILDMYLINYNLVNIKSQYFFEKIFRIFELMIK